MELKKAIKEDGSKLLQDHNIYSYLLYRIYPTSLPTLISFIESTQHLALKLMCKSWSTDYSSQLSQFYLSTLEHRRKIAKVT